jgi:hypothetical protein
MRLVRQSGLGSFLSLCRQFSRRAESPGESDFGEVNQNPSPCLQRLYGDNKHPTKPLRQNDSQRVQDKEEER